MGVVRCGTTFGTDAKGCPMVSYRVFVDGEVYVCDDHQLDQLYQGWPPADLELEPVEDDDPDAERDRAEAASWGRHMRSFGRPDGY